MKIIGIDPGKAGAIAVLDGDKLVEVVKMPPTPMDVLTFLKSHSDGIAYLEELGGMPHMGGTSMFKLGRGYGHLEMALLAAGIRTIKVRPQKWEKDYSLGTKGKAGGYTAWKRVLKAKAQELFPNVKVTLVNSDALLIAWYGYKHEK